MKGTAKSNFKSAIDGLQDQRKEVARKLDDLKSVNIESWQTLRGEVDYAMTGWTILTIRSLKCSRTKPATRVQNPHAELSVVPVRKLLTQARLQNRACFILRPADSSRFCSEGPLRRYPRDNRRHSLSENLRVLFVSPLRSRPIPFRAETSQ